MSMWFLRSPSVPFSGGPAGRQAILWLALLLAAGCSSRNVPLAGPAGEVRCDGPAVIRDYQHEACDTLWQESSPVAMENGLYWLRAMSCAAALSGPQARTLAHRLGGERWPSALKQSLLVSRADPTLAERRQILDRLTRLEGQVSPPLQPLLQLWRTQQAQLILLQEERARYQRLQSGSEARLDELRDERRQLQARLENVQRKLENLTDIERRLSSRKPMAPETKGIIPAPTGADTRKEP